MFSLWIVKKRLQHRLKATTRHGLHSPFVYRLVDKVVYDRTTKKLYADIEKDREKLSQSTDSYSNSARVDQLLYRLVADQNPGNRIDLGIVSPITERYLTEAAPEAKMYRTINNAAQQIDLVVINSVEGDEILSNFNSVLPKVHHASMVIINRIYRNKKSSESWDVIKSHHQVSITVDLFWVGLVFFRIGKVKENFWIRF